MMDGHIQVVGLSYDSNDRRVLSDLSLTIKRGEFLSIVGPSGCGKTTLLKLLCGVLAPTRGEIFIQGVPLKALSPAEHRILMVWQSLALFPHLNVYQNVAFGLSIKHMPESQRDQRVKRVLELVELQGFGARDIAQLSGGERQRVALARALALEPKALLLDEPFGNLHPDLRLRLAAVIRAVHRETGATTVMVTHDQAEARTLSNRIAIMREGILEQVDLANEVFRHPKSEFTAKFLGGRNVLRGKVVRVEGQRLHVLSGTKVLIAHAASGAAAYQVNDEVAYVIDERAVVLGARGENAIPVVMTGVASDGLVETFDLFSSEVGSLRARRIAKDGSICENGRLTTASWSESDAYLLPVSGA